MTTESTLETLNQSLDTALRAGDFATCEDGRGWVKAHNRLLDACIDAGMDREEADYSAWAATRVAQWLLSGVEA